jgi:hypothetical protein
MKIERNVGVPKERKRTKVGELPLEDLNVGDSIVIDFDPEEINKAAHSIRVRCSVFSKNNPKYKFSVHKDSKKNKIRIWRV